MTSARLHALRLASGRPCLLLLHGLGANAEVWRRFIDIAQRDWPGEILAPDLRGHGRSFRGAHYGYGVLAADVADLIDPGTPVYAVGHSMGALVALALATSWFGVDVQRVFAFSVKASWSADELAKVHGLAQAPAKVFEARAQAADRMLRFAGLAGLVDADDPVVEAGVQAVDGGFRLALDPKAFTAPGPDLKAMLSISRAPYAFARGTEDPVATEADAATLPVTQLLLPGLGHNPQVEDPAALWAAIRQAWGALPV